MGAPGAMTLARLHPRPRHPCPPPLHSRSRGPQHPSSSTNANVYFLFRAKKERSKGVGLWGESLGAQAKGAGWGGGQPSALGQDGNCPASATLQGPGTAVMRGEWMSLASLWPAARRKAPFSGESSRTTCSSSTPLREGGHPAGSPSLTLGGGGAPAMVADLASPGSI